MNLSITLSQQCNLSVNIIQVLCQLIDIVRKHVAVLRKKAAYISFSSTSSYHFPAT